MAVSAAFHLWGFGSAHAEPMTYYDIDFSAPTHTVGRPPLERFSLNTISSVVFGEPLVESSFGALTSESLVFNTTGNTPSFFYDQISLSLGRDSDRYQLSFDLSTDHFVSTGSSNRFALIFDTSQVRRIDFNNDGTISYDHPFQGSGVIGSFSDNTLLSITVNVNIAARTWDILMNDNLLHSGIFFPSGGDIESLRFSFGSITSISGSSTFDSVGLDNIQITNGEAVAEVPEFISVKLLLFSLIGTALGCRRKKKTCSHPISMPTVANQTSPLRRLGSTRK